MNNCQFSLRAVGCRSRGPIAVVATVMVLSACGEFVYGIDVVNHGQKGLVVSQFGHFPVRELKPYYTTLANGSRHLNDPRVPGLEGMPFVTLSYPSLPGKYRDSADAIGRFPGKKRSLPDSVEVVWQLAKLTDCRGYRAAQSEKNIDEMRALGRDPEYHRIASDCTWQPLPDKVFRKTVDMSVIRETEAYKQAHGRNSRLNITFEFMDEELRVIPEVYGINRWK